MEVMKILQTGKYEMNGEEKVPIIRNWPAMEGLQLIQTFTCSEKWHAKHQKGCLQHWARNLNHSIMKLY